MQKSFSKKCEPLRDKYIKNTITPLKNSYKDFVWVKRGLEKFHKDRRWICKIDITNDKESLEKKIVDFKTSFNTLLLQLVRSNYDYKNLSELTRLDMLHSALFIHTVSKKENLKIDSKIKIQVELFLKANDMRGATTFLFYNTQS